MNKSKRGKCGHGANDCIFCDTPEKSRKRLQKIMGIKQKHTPTPYKVNVGEPYNEVFLTTANGKEAVCGMKFEVSKYPTKGKHDPQALANASFIVRACNSHDDLVINLEAALPILKKHGYAVQSIVTALNQAKKGE